MLGSRLSLLQRHLTSMNAPVHLTSQLRTSSMRPMQASSARLMSLRF